MDEFDCVVNNAQPWSLKASLFMNLFEAQKQQVSCAFFSLAPGSYRTYRLLLLAGRKIVGLQMLFTMFLTDKPRCY